MSMKDLIRDWEQSQGVDRLGPAVRFFDHAVPANKSAREYTTKGVWKGERPRFKPAVFVEMQTRNDPTASTFREQATDEHKAQYPKEWSFYADRKAQIERRAPPLGALPDMNAATFEELRALRIGDCRELVEYSENLDDLEPIRAQAKSIMETFDAHCHVGQSGNEGRERAEVPENVERPVYSHSVGAGGVGNMHSRNQGGEPVQAKTPAKRLVPGSSVEVFKYEFVA